MMSSEGAPRAKEIGAGSSAMRSSVAVGGGALEREWTEEGSAPAGGLLPAGPQQLAHPDHDEPQDRQCDHRHHELGQHPAPPLQQDRKSTRLNSSHVAISYAVLCLKKKKR